LVEIGGAGAIRRRFCFRHRVLCGLRRSARPIESRRNLPPGHRGAAGQRRAEGNVRQVKGIQVLKMYKETTRSITITVIPTYLDDQSSPEESHYVWKYHVRIENNGDDTVQLRTRHWRITDSMGRVQEVRGPGVVGEQPVLKPGKAFEYTSGTPLPTPSGIMVGTYQMETEQGEKFDVQVPAFSLDSPYQPVKLH
jgi:ApaG protein